MAKVYIAHKADYDQSTLIGAFTSFELAADQFGLKPGDFHQIEMWGEYYFYNRPDDDDDSTFGDNCAVVEVVELDTPKNKSIPYKTAAPTGN